MLAWSLAKRMVNFGSAVMGGLQGLQAASMSGNASAAAATGNTSMGNVSMDQRTISPLNLKPMGQSPAGSGRQLGHDNSQRRTGHLLPAQ